MKNILATIGLSLVLTTSLTPLAAHAAELSIGELHPVTGAASFYGAVMSRTLKMEADELNAAGGLDIAGTKYTLNIETGDDQAQATVGVAALRKLLSSNVHFILGPLASAVAPAIKPIIESNPNVLQIIDGSIADGVVNGKNSFRVQSSADTYNNAVITHLKEDHVANVAIMSDRTHQGFMMSGDRMAKSLNDAGIKVLAHEYFALGDTDFSAQLTKLRAVNPSTLVLRGYPGEGALITKQAQQLGFTGKIVWEMGAPPSTVMKNIPAAQMEGIVNCIPRMTADYIRLKLPNALTLAEHFKAKYNEEPGENAAFSNDAFWILVTAMKKAGSISAPAVAKELTTLKVDEVPHLIIQYQPYEGGLLFKDGQANPPSAAQIWHNDSWQNMPGDRVTVTTKN